MDICRVFRCASSVVFGLAGLNPAMRAWSRGGKFSEFELLV